MNIPRVGFIGLGMMGHGMAANLLRKGFPLAVKVNRDRSRIADLLAGGARECRTNAEAGHDADFVILCVAGSPQVEDIVFGSDGLIGAARPGLTVIDTTTAEPGSTARIRKAFAAKGTNYVDAPLARTPKEAEEGRLNAMVGADDATFERVKPVLQGLRTLGMDDFGDLLRGSTALAGAAPVTCEDDPAFLIFTSGTTGRAKAVSVPHRAACGFSQVSGFSEAYGRGLFGVPLPAAGVPVPPSDDVVLVTSPLFHVSMLYGAVVMGAVKGFRMVLLPGRFEPERVLQAIERERVTLWMALGSAAPRVVGCPALRDYDTSSLRQVGIGGAPVSPTLQESLRSAFPSTGRLLGMGYTSTEAGAVIASIGGPEFERHPTSTGRVSLTVEVELRDAAGQPVAAGEEGEVHVRSPYLMLGYWNDAKATASAQKAGGWLAMGDVARFEEGLLYINARARDMLLVSAENVSPTEIEYCLEAHPRVLEAAAVGVDDPLTGDAVCAFVVVDPANRPETSELEDWCRRSLAHYKVPSVWLLTHDPLPRTPSGKVIKSEVRARIEAHYRRGR